MSPSMRREWIEISDASLYPYGYRSPSMRREWIEMSSLCLCPGGSTRSPSMRREWIEMSPSRKEVLTRQVSLHAEGVD